MNNSNTACHGPVPQDMLEILMNGVFAFAMTLIVKNNIPLPSGNISENAQYFIDYFARTFFDGFSFILTFVLLAIFYILVFEIMKHILFVDRIFVYLVFAFLLSILFIPLTSLLWSISDDPIPYGILFDANILIAGSLLFILWNYVCRVPHILNQCTSKEFMKNLSLRIGVFPVTALFGFIIDGQKISFWFVPIIALYLIPILVCICYSPD
jgi:uncharacterized membrane protein